jgi:hypothetical protein
MRRPPRSGFATSRVCSPRRPSFIGFEKLTKTETKVRVPGVPTPALMLTGSRPGLTPASRGTLVGYTAITFVSEDVILEAFTTSRSSKSRGDARTTVALAELAYRHLTTVARRLTG